MVPLTLVSEYFHDHVSSSLPRNAIFDADVSLVYHLIDPSTILIQNGHRNKLVSATSLPVSVAIC